MHLSAKNNAELQISTTQTIETWTVPVELTLINVMSDLRK